MSCLIMRANDNLYFAEPNPDCSGIRFYKHDGKKFRWLATIIDNGDSFTYCRLVGRKIYSKELNPKDESLWSNRNGNPIKESDTEEQLCITTNYNRKMLVRFPDVIPHQNSFLIGHYDGKVFKLISDARVICNTLSFTFNFNL